MTRDEQIARWKDRPMSYSQFSTWAYSDRSKDGKEEWFKKYILGEETRPNPELIFGKKFADSIEAGKPLAPVTMLSKAEKQFDVVISGNVKLTGRADLFDDKTLKETGEIKTGVAPWDQERVDSHDQITMYALMNFITNKIKPDDCKFWLEWVPTEKIELSNGDFSGYDYEIKFKEPIEIFHFDTKRTMKDISFYLAYIKNTRAEMEAFAIKHK
jgi:hypothetical protein